MNRTELQQLANLRLTEAKALLAANLPAGAYYLAGYAVECALKACIAKGVQQYDFPERSKVLQSYSHNLVDLVKGAQLWTMFETALQANQSLAGNWAAVSDWNETSRYIPTRDPIEARDLIDAIGDPANGILPWLTHHW